jgi:hypothetical protein
MTVRYTFLLTSGFCFIISFGICGIVLATSRNEYMANMIGFGILVGLAMIQFVLYKLSLSNVLLFGMIGVWIFLMIAGIIYVVNQSTHNGRGNNHSLDLVQQSRAGYITTIITYMLGCMFLFKYWGIYR